MQLVARHRDVPDLVLAALDDRDRDDEAVLLRVGEDDPLLRDLDVEVAVLPVVVPQLVQVVLEIVVLEAAGVREPREHPPLLRVHLLPELLRLDVGVADEPDLLDLHLPALPDLEGDRAEARRPVARDRVADRDLVEALLLVELLELLGVVLDLALVERGVGRGLDLLLEAAGLDQLVALVLDREHPVLRRHLEHEVERARVDGLALDLDELEEARLVEGPDVPIEHRLVEVAALADLDVGAHELLVDIGRPDELHRYRADPVARR